MSENNQAVLPSADQAYNKLFADVHANAFFGKLAQYGIQPATELEAEELLKMAAQLRHVPHPEKQASEQSRFSNALAALHATVGNTAGYQSQVAVVNDYNLKTAAAQLAQDNDLYKSVLALKLHEAAVANGQA